MDALYQPPQALAHNALSPNSNVKSPNCILLPDIFLKQTNNSPVSRQESPQHNGSHIPTMDLA